MRRAGLSSLALIKDRREHHRERLCNSTCGGEFTLEDGDKVKITLCGSLRFENAVQQWHERLAFAGHTVYSMVALPSQKGDNKDWYTPAQKQTLDLLHLSKIEESDAIFVVNVDGYIGESTRREIEWAQIRCKTIYTIQDAHYLLGDVNVKSDSGEEIQTYPQQSGVDIEAIGVL
jgi:hypothetical protein